MATRKSISKKTRFEVFKRDSFTCQYCGRKSPDVVLHVDHIKPIANGGKNTVMNYVTSCVDCNLGKGPRELSDSTTVEKSRKQSELLQQRREQIEMMRDWQLALVESDNIEVEAINDLYLKLTDGKFEIADSYKSKTILPLVRKYGVFEVMEALRAGAASYGEPKKALNKISGICYCRNNKEAERKEFLLNILNKRFYNFKRDEASVLVQNGINLGGDEFCEQAKKLAYEVSGTWHQVKNYFYDLVDGFEG